MQKGGKIPVAFARLLAASVTGAIPDNRFAGGHVGAREA
jgi:hypothetical protein